MRHPFCLAALLVVMTSVVSARNELRTNEVLWSGEQIVSNNGRYRLINQGDGNLVLYNRNDRALWSSGTAGKGSGRLVMQGDGHLVLYFDNGDNWGTHKYRHKSGVLILQDDGNAVVYDADGAVWASATVQPNTEGLVNVYKLIHSGIDVFHTGVVLGGKEFYFNSDGRVYSVPPGTFNDRLHRTMSYGTDKSEAQVTQELSEVINRFDRSRYDFFDHNCNSFTDAVLRRLFNTELDKAYLNQMGGLQSVARHIPGSSTLQELFTGGKIDQAVEHDVMKIPGTSIVKDLSTLDLSWRSVERDVNKLPFGKAISGLVRKLF